ncbi:MAG: N-acetylneuraminate synthase [Deltaproteobacteria bacterium RBG_13_47_9]|nr:MAG: N-acetylneuraminate synthase [Deltaproteobacteria bacterium RBG_13_47_9]
MKRQIAINGRVINDETDCYIIAEIGHNHQGDLQKAKELFNVAKACGAEAVKLQKRNNRKLFTKELFNKPYENPNSFGETYGEHREYLEFGKKEYEELKQYAKEIEIDFFATAFDFASADFLAELDMPAFKIASGDLNNIPLLKYVAKIGKPMIVSTGGATMENVKRAYDAIMPLNENLCILQCTAAYPAEHDILNLNVISTYRKAFPKNVIGLSDHENGIAMAIAAFVLGARIFEKHFTLNHTWKGTDHAFSLEPVGFRKLVRDLKRLPKALGNGIKTVYDIEKEPIKKMGKSIVASRNLKKGMTVFLKDLAFKSPGGGLPPYEFEKIIGKKLKVSMKEDQLFSLDIVKE